MSKEETLNAVFANREKIRALLYTGKDKPCAVADMKDVDGSKKIIFPDNGYEVEYADQSLKITNGRDHKDFSLTISDVDDEKANKLLVGIQNYDDRAPITLEAIHKTIGYIADYERASQYVKENNPSVQDLMNNIRGGRS